MNRPLTWEAVALAIAVGVVVGTLFGMLVHLVG